LIALNIQELRINNVNEAKMCRFFPYKQLLVKRKMFKIGCVIIIMMCCV